MEEFVESLGAKVVCAAACFGEYDFVAVVDYRNEVAGRCICKGKRSQP
jgi:uncharacterized protein with GYD domain